MTILELTKRLGLDSEVTAAVEESRISIDFSEIKTSCEMLLTPAEWEKGIKKLLAYCGDDPQGMKILTIYLHCITDTYERYIRKGIPEKIFFDTMGFIPRFLNSHKQAWGIYAFTWAWWMPRQISMNEFRIGELEYEFSDDNGTKKIWIHIPSDAKLDKSNIKEIYPFLEKFYPEYVNAQIACDSWLLSPALKNLLPQDSNILIFQEQFNVTHTDWESPWFMGWIWTRNDIPINQLPENTTLQRNVKKHLISGGKIGSAYGEYIK